MTNFKSYLESVKTQIREVSVDEADEVMPSSTFMSHHFLLIH